MKQKKKIIGIIVSILIIVLLVIAFLFQERKVAVLCYHNLGTAEEKTNFPEEASWTIEVQNFEEQLQYLQKHGYKTLTLEEFTKWKKKEIELPYHSVLITFDDGFLSNYQYAFPLLKKYEMNAVVFIVGEYMGEGIITWRGDLHDYLTKDMIEKAKEEYPNIEFASHSYGLHHHGSIEEKTAEEIGQDLAKFETKMQKTKHYAYPFGAKNEKMKQELKAQGYEIAFIYGPTKKEYRKASRKDDNYEIPRLNMSHGMNKTKFAIRLAMPF